MASPPTPPPPVTKPATPAQCLSLVDHQLRARVVAALNLFLQTIYKNHSENILKRARQYESICNKRAVTLPHYCMLVKQVVHRIVQVYHTTYPGTEGSLNEKTNWIIGILDANFRMFRVVPIPAASTARVSSGSGSGADAGAGAGTGATASAESGAAPVSNDSTATLDLTTAASANTRAVGAVQASSATRLVNNPTGWTPVINPKVSAPNTVNTSTACVTNHTNAPVHNRRTNRAVMTSRSSAVPIAAQVPAKTRYSPAVAQFLGSLGMVTNDALCQNLPNGNAANTANFAAQHNVPTPASEANMNALNPNLLTAAMENAINLDLLSANTRNAGMADLSNPSALMASANRAPNAMVSNPMATNATTTNSMATNGSSTNPFAATAIAANPVADNHLSANEMPAKATVTHALTGNAIGSNQMAANAVAANAMVSDPIAYPFIAPNSHVSQAHTNVPVAPSNNPNQNMRAISNTTMPAPTIDPTIHTNPNTDSVPNTLQQQLPIPVPPYVPAGNPQLAQRNSVSASIATAASHRMKGSSRMKTSPHSRGKGFSDGNTPARTASRKRNSSAAGIQQPPMTSAPAHRPHKTTTTQVPKASIQSQTRAVRTTTQKMPGANKPAVPEKKAASNELENRVFLNERAFVTVHDVAATAASCGYKLDEKTIRGLNPTEVIRFYVRVRQDALQKACKSASDGNGKLRISMEHLDAIGIQYQTIDHSLANATQTSPNQASSGVVQNSLPILGTQGTTASSPARPNNPHIMRRAISNVQHGNGMQKHHTISGSPPGRAVQSQSDFKSTKELKAINAATLRPNSSSCPAFVATQGMGTRKNAPEHQSHATNQLSPSHPTTGKAPAVEDNPKGSTVFKGNASNYPSQLGTVSPQSTPADVVARVEKFQRKYTRYLETVKTVLARLVEMNCTENMQLIFFQHTITLMTKPVSGLQHLSMDFIDKIEIFLRELLVRCRNVPLNQSTKQKKEPKGEAVLPNTTASNSNYDVQVVPESEKAATSKDVPSNPPSKIECKTPAPAVPQNEDPAPTNTVASNSQARTRATALTEKNKPKVEPQAILRNEETSQVTARAGSPKAEPRSSGNIQVSEAFDTQTHIPTSVLQNVQGNSRTVTEPVAKNDYSEVFDKLHKIYESVTQALHDAKLCAEIFEPRSPPLPDGKTHH